MVFYELHGDVFGDTKRMCFTESLVEFLSFSFQKIQGARSSSILHWLLLKAIFVCLLRDYLNWEVRKEVAVLWRHISHAWRKIWIRWSNFSIVYSALTVIFSVWWVKNKSDTSRNSSLTLARKETVIGCLRAKHCYRSYKFCRLR